ncbi:MAG: hypothetical protein COT43_11135 [Candidatus Marinimicrobia bacterium CG08_land_8_20_14_0_20_45_22]|nr:MAG: hypothetical protein COT43_11135 [Candidatus Marinimicrobia bacterium CG08_land_8_20_14_0_20_45_22]
MLKLQNLCSEKIGNDIGETGKFHLIVQPIIPLIEMHSAVKNLVGWFEAFRSQFMTVILRNSTLFDNIKFRRKLELSSSIFKICYARVI